MTRHAGDALERPPPTAVERPKSRNRWQGLARPCRAAASLLVPAHHGLSAGAVPNGHMVSARVPHREPALCPLLASRGFWRDLLRVLQRVALVPGDLTVRSEDEVVTQVVVASEDATKERPHPGDDGIGALNLLDRPPAQLSFVTR